MGYGGQCPLVFFVHFCLYGGCDGRPFMMFELNHARRRVSYQIYWILAKQFALLRNKEAANHRCSEISKVKDDVFTLTKLFLWNQWCHKATTDHLPDTHRWMGFKCMILTTSEGLQVEIRKAFICKIFTKRCTPVLKSLLLQAKICYRWFFILHIPYSIQICVLMPIFDGNDQDRGLTNGTIWLIE